MNDKLRKLENVTAILDIVIPIMIILVCKTLLTMSTGPRVIDINGNSATNSTDFSCIFLSILSILMALRFHLHFAKKEAINHLAVNLFHSEESDN